MSHRALTREQLNSENWGVLAEFNKTVTRPMTNIACGYFPENIGLFFILSRPVLKYPAAFSSAWTFVNLHAGCFTERKTNRIYINEVQFYK